MAVHPQITIIIATHNRPQLLTHVLASLEPANPEFEIKVIENDYGLARARNLGWKEAKGDYVAYIDDDAVADPKWISEILKFIKSHPEVSALGGPYTSSNVEDLPTWIPLELISMQLNGTEPRPISLGSEWLTGTNMIFRRSLLEELGGFDENLGVKGNSRGYGEETDLLIRIHNAGHEIWYVPAIRVRHEFASVKQSWFYLVRDQFIHGKNSHETFRHLKRSAPIRTANTALTRLRRRNLHWKTRAYFAGAPVAYILGMLWGRITQK